MYAIWKTVPKWLQIAVFALSAILVVQLFTGSEPPAVVNSQQCDSKNKGPFDGRVLYACTLKAVAEKHRNLGSLSERRAWLDEWQGKFDHTDLLKTEQGTLKAITEMLLSVKGRFDFVFTPERVADNEIIEKGQMAGIGAAVATPKASDLSQAQAMQALPEHASPQLIAMLKMDKAPAAIISQNNPLLVIAEPKAGTPANTGGMKKGDIIFAVDGEEVSGKTIDGVIGKIRGAPGSALKLTVIREGEKKELSLVRAMVDLNTTSERKIGEDVGYLRIDHFESMRVVDDVHNSLDKLCNAAKQSVADSHAVCDAKTLIVDLRGNPGGILQAVLVVSEFFLDKGDLASVMMRDGDQTLRTDFTLSTTQMTVKEGSDSRSQQRYFDAHFPSDRKIVVLVDEYSASGAEALATILQQQRNAVVVGRQTRGKGVGQCPIPLPYGYAANFICMEYLAGGKAVDWLGVTPDVTVVQPKVTTAEASEGSEVARQDLQLETALRIARGEQEVVKTDPAVQAEQDRQIVAERRKAYDEEVEDTLKRFFNK